MHGPGGRSVARVCPTSTPKRGADALHVAEQIRAGAEAEAVQANEARGIFLVVSAGIILEGDHRFVVKAIGLAAPTENPHLALVELEAHFPVHRCLGSVDERLEALPLRGKPIPVVDAAPISMSTNNPTPVSVVDPKPTLETPTTSRFSSEVEIFKHE